MKFTLPIALLLLLGCNQAGDDSVDDTPAAANRLKVVSLVELQKRPVARTTTQSATVHAYQQAEIHSKVAGYLQTLKADIGQSLKKDAQLGVIQVPEMVKARESQAAEVKRLQALEKRYDAEKLLAAANEQAAVASHKQAQALVLEADAKLAAETKERDRVRELVADKSVASRLLDEAEKKYAAAAAAKTAAEAAAAAAKSQIAVAKAKVSVADQIAKASKEETNVAKKKLAEMDELMKYATLQAPFAGVITERNVDVGDLVRNVQTATGKPRQPLFVLADLSKVRIHVMVPEHDAGSIQPGAEVALKFRALPGYQFKSPPKVTRTAKMLDKQTQTMLVEIELENTKANGSWSMLPGMYGEATIILNRRKDALVLPAEAVRFDSKGNSTVYVVNAEDTIRIAKVKTGVDFGDQIEITEGLNPGDRIVGPLIGRLKAGQKVRVRK